MMQDRNELTKLATALGGLPVLACRPGSPAAVAGVRYGDILLTVNGVKTPDWTAFIEARSLDKQVMRIELFRDGETLLLEFELSPVTAPVDTPALLAEILAERIVPLDLTSRAKPN